MYNTAQFIGMGITHEQVQGGNSIVIQAGQLSTAHKITFPTRQGTRGLLAKYNGGIWKVGFDGHCLLLEQGTPNQQTAGSAAPAAEPNARTLTQARASDAIGED